MSRSASSRTKLNAKNPDDARIIVGEITSALDKARLRKRAEQACTECSKHHRKCETDEGKSRCKRCDKNNIDCSFSARVSPSDHDSDSPTARTVSSTRGGYRSSNYGTASAPAGPAAGGGYVNQVVDPHFGFPDPRYSSTQQQSPTMGAHYPPDLASPYAQHSHSQHYPAYSQNTPAGWSNAPSQMQSGGVHGWAVPHQQQQHALPHVAAGSYNTGHVPNYQQQPPAVQQRYFSSNDGTYCDDQQQMDANRMMRYSPPGQSYGQYPPQTNPGGNSGLGYYHQQ